MLHVPRRLCGWWGLDDAISVRNIARGYCGWGVSQPAVSVYRSEIFHLNPFENKKDFLRYKLCLSFVWFVYAETKKMGEEKKSGVWRM